MRSDERDTKIILVGEAATGKTHLVQRYITGTLPKAPSATVGAERATRTVPLATGGTVKAQIWDTGGLERYRVIMAPHLCGAVGALLVYDVTKRATFHSCVYWMDELRARADLDCVIMLVGNKVDMVEKDPATRQVPFDLASEFARENQLIFAEASAVTSHNVKHIFECLLQEIYNNETKVAVRPRFPKLPPQQELSPWEDSPRAEMAMATELHEAVAAGHEPGSPEAKAWETPSTSAESPDTPDSTGQSETYDDGPETDADAPRWTEEIKDVVTFATPAAAEVRMAVAEARIARSFAELPASSAPAAPASSWGLWGIPTCQPVCCAASEKEAEIATLVPVVAPGFATSAGAVSKNLSTDFAKSQSIAYV